MIRNAAILASLLTMGAYSTIGHAQEGNSANPATDTRTIDASAFQSPWGRSDIDISRHDRVYSTDNSGGIAVTDPNTSEQLGVIKGSTLSLQHLATPDLPRSRNDFLAYSPNGKMVIFNTSTQPVLKFLDTLTNQISDTLLPGGSPRFAAYSPNGKSIWVSVQRSQVIDVLDATTRRLVQSIKTRVLPGAIVFSNNGKYAYVCSEATGRIAILNVGQGVQIGDVEGGPGPLSSIAASPDGKQIWATSRQSGKLIAFSAKPPFRILSVMDIGSSPSGVNFVNNDDGQFAFIALSGANAVAVFDTRNYRNVGNIDVGSSPQGLWPSGDGTRLFVALGAQKSLVIIDTASRQIVDSVRLAQDVDTVIYVPGAVHSGNGLNNLTPRIY